MAYNPFEAMANEWESYFNSIQAIMGEELTEEEKATLENKINPIHKQVLAGLNSALSTIDEIIKLCAGDGKTIILDEKFLDNVVNAGKKIGSDFTLYWSSCAGHFYLRIFILQWAHPIVGCMRPFKIVIMNELRDFLFNSVFIHSRSVA